MFKFYKIPSDDIIDKIIGEQATIKLSSAFNLNDPYELKFNLDLDPMDKGHEKEFYKDNPGNSQDDFRRWQKHALEHSGYTWYNEQQLRNALAQKISICSFSEDNKNNLMWSHYTDNHKGICVEYTAELFEYLKTQKGYLIYCKVNYSKEPPTIKGLEDINSKIKKMIFNKQSEWFYEKERRVVFLSNKDEKYIPIDRKYIKSVYIGSRADKELEQKVLSVCENSNINIFYGITLGKSYELQFEKRKDGTYYSSSFWK